MKKLYLLFLPFLFLQLSFAQQVAAPVQHIATPDEIYGQLFVDVQMNKIFPDGKTFVDCIPKRNPKAIVQDYLSLKNNPAVRFSLQRFVEENFILPQAPQSQYITKSEDVQTHIRNLWKVLKRHNDTAVTGSSLLPLPYPYIVPGGRFREIYYWDSYFTMLGLKESREEATIENMIKNFAYLINTYGHIPNGNRTYYLSRSQPPYFSLMVALLAGIKGDSVYKTYLPAMKKEHAYWMDKTAPTKHVVTMPDGSLLNRYYDQQNKPRQESYAEDVATAKSVSNQRTQIYRELRTGAESGMDFSSRWFKDGEHLTTIQVAEMVAVDLNCLLYALEKNIAKGYSIAGNPTQANYYNQLGEKRKRAINKYCWSAKDGWYVDYNIITKKQSSELTLAGMEPFFLQVAPADYIDKAAATIRSRFLQPGGVNTSLKHTGEQWDAPNGWAPLEWITIAGLNNYHQKELAKTVAKRWMELNVAVFKRTGKLMEKYNVEDIHLEAGGGEYPSQDGFGWTNGVLAALIAQYGLDE